MNIVRRAAQLVVDINKIQAEAIFKMYSRFGLCRRLYVACGFSEDAAKRLDDRLVELGHEGATDQHEILRRFVRGDVGAVQLIEDLAQWFSAYMENCQAAAIDELRTVA